MASDRIMWAVTSPGAVAADTSAARKVLSLAAAFGAELEIFHCAYDAGVAKPDRFASQGVELDIREIVERRHEQLEYSARELRGRGVDVRTSVRWDRPAHAGIVRQVLRREPSLLVAHSREMLRAERLGGARTDLKLIETCPCPLLLIKTARPLGAARIVAFGAATRGLLRKAWLGHTAERLLDRLDCDVLVAKPLRFRSPIAAGSVHRLEHRTARPGRCIF